MSTDQDVEKYLKSLGGSSRKIKKSLQKMNIKGYRGRPSFCPIANFLKQATDVQTESFFVTGPQVMVLRETGESWVALPAGVSNFVGEFDSGTFPELEADRVRG